MALSIPRDWLDNAGDYTRWQMACWAFLIFAITYDPRVKVAWHQWTTIKGLDPWVVRRWTEAPVTFETLKGLTDALLHTPDPEDLEWFERLVHDELQMPYTWFPRYLRHGFQMWTAKQLQLPEGVVPAAVLMTLPHPEDLPPGRQPRDFAHDIARNVGWLYQNRYLPVVWTEAGRTIPMRRSKKAIATDWTARVQGRAGHRGDVDARKLVREGIKQADALLDLAHGVSEFLKFPLPPLEKPVHPRGVKPPAPTVNEQDAAHYIGYSPAYLRKARQQGRGPAYIRIGRTIRYRIPDLDSWQWRIGSRRGRPRERRSRLARPGHRGPQRLGSRAQGAHREPRT